MILSNSCELGVHNDIYIYIDSTFDIHIVNFATGDDAIFVYNLHYFERYVGKVGVS